MAPEWPPSEEGVCLAFCAPSPKTSPKLEGRVEVAECSLSVTTLLCYDRPNEEMMDSCLREPGLEPLLCSNWDPPPADPGYLVYHGILSARVQGHPNRLMKIPWHSLLVDSFPSPCRAMQT